MQEFVGKVTKRPFGKGSKSEHDAVYLETGEKAYVLRRQGGNPFRDPQLEGPSMFCRARSFLSGSPDSALAVSSKLLMVNMFKGKSRTIDIF